MLAVGTSAELFFHRMREQQQDYPPSRTHEYENTTRVSGWSFKSVQRGAFRCGAALRSSPKP